MDNEAEDDCLELENYEVVTEDGYILTLCRIPGKKDDEDGLEEDCGRPPVLICHGLICQGTHWLMNRDDKCLPYILNNAGYDCWLANLRGTTLSKRHKTLDVKSQEFWDFSFDQMARYDLPAMINFILEETGRPQLYYVGHSMGCLIFFISMSMFPENSQKVKKMIALAPSVYGKNISNWYLKLGVYCGSSVAKIRSIYCRQVPSNKTTISDHIHSVWIPFIKNPDQIGAWLISTIGVRFGMFGREQIEASRLPSISKQWPSTTSLKTILHMSQLYSSEVKAYDHGVSTNLLLYNNDTPPKYDITNIQVPVLVFSSEGDELCAADDIKQVVKDLPKVIEHIHINDPLFSHIDFMAGKDADIMVYQHILNTFNGKSPIVPEQEQ